MSGEYETMGRGELLARLEDWMRVATDRADRIVELDAERDRLRAVVDAAMLLWYATYPTGPAPARFIEARRAFEEAAAQLDVSEVTSDG